MMKKFSLILLLLLGACGIKAGEIGGWKLPGIVSFENSGGFCLAHGGQVAPLCVDDKDWTGVRLAVKTMADDVERVTGVRPSVSSKAAAGAVVVGTIGHSRFIDNLIKQKKLDVTALSGQWESFAIATVGDQLVIVGSDRRGTIYGIYELSRQIGVSPWYWWADVPVQHHSSVYIAAGCHLQPSPRVKYRGIFINDEDWGLKPWAANNYEKELGDIGPRTYARVCELLLRLKANMLAPAMHSCTGAFYSHPESKAVCDSMGIVITTSHCEPLLFNNAAESEWDQQRDGDWNYKTNSKTILRKWDDRLSEAAKFENIYTVAMRGLHDAGLRGNLPMEERVPLIEQVIRDQRKLLVKHKTYFPQSLKGMEEASIPQIFVPYKETMDIYEHGLRVPDDITLVWVDDNYGYMKRVSNPNEQKRSGRAGVYYHLSYLGAPHDYLWLNTTAPVLMYEELMKAFRTGADRYWLLNVGDIKPMELGLQTFVEMAWNPEGFSFERVNSHQAAFLAETFGMPAETATLQALLDDYYRLAWSRKPEFMGWEYEWDDAAHTGLKSTDYSFGHYAEAQRRLADYQRISDQAERLAVGAIPAAAKAAFFELLQFSVQAAYQMNRKFLMAQLNRELLAQGRAAEANWAARQMEQAYDSISALNRRYNRQIGGKWDGMMDIPPGYCALYHEKPVVTYTEGVGEKTVALPPSLQSDMANGCYVIDLADYNRKTSDVQIVKGLGYDWKVVRLGSPLAQPMAAAPSVSYSLPAIARDSIDVVLYTVPFWPLFAGRSNAVSVSVDGSQPKTFVNTFKEYDRSWKDQVMRNGIACRLRFAVNVTKSSHTLTVSASDPGQMVQRIIVDWGGLQPSYIGPSPSILQPF